MTQLRPQGSTRGGTPPGATNPSGGQRPVRQPFPDGYLREGYFDAAENVLPAVIQEWPHYIAGTLYEAKMASTQLRRFFDRVRSIEREFKTNKDFDGTKEKILVLKPLAAYAVGRETAPTSFETFIDKNVTLAVKDPKSFTRGFVTHFQSVVAYLKYEELTKGKRGR